MLHSELIDLDLQGHDIRSFLLAGGKGQDAGDVALWYCGHDVCGHVGLRNTRDALPRVPRETRMRVRFEDGAPRAGNAREMWFIDGAGFRWLIRERPTMHHDVHGWLMFNDLMIDGIMKSGKNKVFMIDECNNGVYTLKDAYNDNSYYSVPFNDDKAFYADIDKDGTMDNDGAIVSSSSIGNSSSSSIDNSISGSDDGSITNTSSIRDSRIASSSIRSSKNNNWIVPIDIANEIQKFIDNKLVFKKDYRLLYREICSKFRKWWMVNASKRLRYKVPPDQHLGNMLKKTYKYSRNTPSHVYVYHDVDFVK
jgi:hypothetical protein